MTEKGDVPQEKTRSYSYKVVPFDQKAAMEMSGMEFLQAMLQGKIGGRPSIGATMGFTGPFVEKPGEVAFEAMPGDHVLNPMNTVHGGFAATILDSALGCAVHSALPKATGYTTAELKVNYTRAILPTSGTLRATGKIIHIGRRMATAEARLEGVEDGKLYAHGSTTCFVFPL